MAFKLVFGCNVMEFYYSKTVFNWVSGCSEICHLECVTVKFYTVLNNKLYPYMKCTFRLMRHHRLESDWLVQRAFLKMIMVLLTTMDGLFLVQNMCHQ